MLRSYGFRRLTHALAMAAFGAASGLLLLLHPYVGWVLADPLLWLASVAAAAVLLGELLWDRPLFHDHPIFSGCCLALAASIGANVIHETLKAPSLCIEDPVGLLGVGLLLGTGGATFSLPFSAILGVAMVQLSGWLHVTLEVWGDPSVDAPGAPSPEVR